MKLTRQKSRNLYNLATGRHVTRDELLDAIREGEAVQATQAGTDQDCTAKVLHQVLGLALERGDKIPIAPLLEALRAGGKRTASETLEHLTARLLGRTGKK